MATLFFFRIFASMSVNLNDYILTVPPSQAKSEKGSKQINANREYITIASLSTLLGSGGSAIKQQVDKFSDLVAGSTVGDIAYTREDEGTAWLPGALGGTFYSKGFYLWDGSVWTSDRNVIANQFRLNALELANKTDVGHTHVAADITDLQTIQGPQGPVGPKGDDGDDGANGTNGTNGTNGDSAYEVAVTNGFSGTESEWLASLVGADGADSTVAGPQGDEGPEGPQGPAGTTDYNNLINTPTIPSYGLDCARYTMSTTQSVDSTTLTSMAFPTEAFNTDSSTFGNTNQAQKTIGADGIYRITSMVSIFGTTSNYRWTGEIGIRVNGSGTVFTNYGGYVRSASGSNETSVHVDSLVQLNRNDTVEIVVRRISSTSGNGETHAARCSLDITRIN